MDLDVDQFGRNKKTSSSNNLKEDKSKRILESLSEIKAQLQSKNFSPNNETNNVLTKKKIDNSIFKDLNLKILNLEKRLIKISQTIQLSENEDLYIKPINKVNEKKEESIFNNYDDEKPSGNQKNDVFLEIKEKEEYKISQFKFYHFLLIFGIMIILLLFLTSLKLGLSFGDIIKIFLKY